MPPKSERPEQTVPETLAGAEETIAVLKLKGSHYLVQEKPDGAVVLTLIDPEKEQLAYIRATRKLRDKHFIEFDHQSITGIKVVNFGLSSPKIEWASRTQPTEEPTIVIPTTNATKSQPETIRIYEEELLDLFTDNKPDQQKKASFFVVDSVRHEMIGIALNREYPVIIFIQPAKDGGTLVPQQGLILLLEGIYQEYRKRLSSLQRKVDDRIFEEFGPRGLLELNVSSSGGSTGMRHQELVKSIFRMKALIAAGEADNKGTGLSDAKLKALLPFIGEVDVDEDDDDNGGGFLSRLFGGDEDKPKKEEKGKRHKIGFEQWNGLLASETKGLFNRADATAQYRPWQGGAPRSNSTTQPPAQTQIQPPTRPSRPQSPVKPARPAQATRPTQPDRLTQPARPVRHNRPVQPTRPTPPTGPARSEQPARPEPVSRLDPEIARQRGEEKMAEIFARRVNGDLEKAVTMFSQIEIKQLNESSVDQLAEILEKILLRINEYFDNHEPPAGSLQTRATVSARDTQIRVGSLDPAGVFAFLTGYKGVEYQEKISLAINAWHEQVKVAMVLADDRFSRTYRGMKRERSNLASQNPDLANVLITAARRCSNEYMSEARNADVIVLAHVAITLQIIDSLLAQYQHLISNVTPREGVRNWLKYSQIILRKISRMNYLKTSK